MVDNIAIPLFEHNWTAEEELLLLESIEMYGVGNWRDVSEHVGSHSRQDCEYHYVERYMKSSSKPLPVRLSADVLKEQAKAHADKQNEKQEGAQSAVEDQKEGYVPFQYDSARNGGSVLGLKFFCFCSSVHCLRF